VKRLASLPLAALALTVAAVPILAAATFPARINLPNGFAPEGITAGRGTTVYVGSLMGGAIRRVDVRTGEDGELVPAVSGRVAVGTEFEDGAGRLWVAGGPTGAVRVYDATTGALLATYQFAGSPTFLNDLVVTREAVYVTDSLMPRLAVIPLGPGGELPAPSEVTTIPLGGDIQYVAGFNANGIEFARGWLIIVQSNTGRLFRVNPADGTATEIDLGGASVSAGDGILLIGSTLYVVRNQLNRVAVFRLSAEFASAQHLGDITSADLDVPTTVAFVAGRLWAVNARFGTPVTPDTPYWITQLPATT
jgi:sugar lactone lactonase YvrE